MKMERFLSFWIVMGVYLAAGAAGVCIFLVLPFDVWASLLIADIAATVIVFLFSLLFRNASVYDPYWSVQPIVIGIAFAAAYGLTVSSALALTAVILWGVRLTSNWAYTFRGLSYQDWRYTMLKQKTGRLYFFVNLFGIHLVPTLVVYGCVLPLVFLIAEAPAFQAGAAVFFVFCLAAILLQGIADCTMHLFRKQKKSGFNRMGVWKYSRHPNYLGEIAMWWGIALMCVCVLPEDWFLIAGAAANTLLFLFVSIPLADGHQARKPGFAAYKRNTRMLLPVYKKQVRTR